MSDAPKSVGRLIVTRYIGESVWIGEGIEVRVDGIDAKRARLVIIAPRDVIVRRSPMFTRSKTDEGAKP